MRLQSQHFKLYTVTNGTSSASFIFGNEMFEQAGMVHEVSQMIKSDLHIDDLLSVLPRLKRN